MRRMHIRHWLLGLAGLCLAAMPTSLLPAQESAAGNVTFPSTQGMLKIEAQMPDEVRVNQDFEFSVQVTNVTENIMLHSVKIEQTASGPFEIESARIGQSKAQQNKSNKSKQKGKQGKGSDSNKISSDNKSFTIDKLMPGESRMIHLRGSADETGQLQTCLAVTAYRPTICLTTKVVKAELDIAKKAPKRANVCEVIEYEYFVQNDGSANLKKFTVRDSLPDGIRTIEGEKKLSFTVDGLKAGDTRKFVAKVVATKSGEYSSRAIAERPNGESVRSSKPTTTVEAAELAVNIEGPSTVYVGRTANYKICVANVGNAIAPDAQLVLGMAQPLEVVRVGTPYPTQRSSDQLSQFTNTSGQPTLAVVDKNNKQSNNQKRQVRGRPSFDSLASQELDLGDLQPGQCVELTFTATTENSGQHPLMAKAMFICGKDDLSTTVDAVAMARTEFIALPALLVAVVDNQDPVRNGEQVTYTILVENQGDAPDHDVQIEATLPDSLEFVEADGPTKAKTSGDTITFGKVDQLAPGEKARWLVTVKANGSGEVVFETKLTSKGLSKPANSEEPTQLFGSN